MPQLFAIFDDEYLSSSSIVIAIYLDKIRGSKTNKKAFQ